MTQNKDHAMDLGPIVFDLQGTQLSKEDERILAHPLIGGIILFTRNYENPEQLRELVSQIRSVRSNCLLMVDQEGGRVQRFKEGFSRLPNLRLLGHLYDTHPSKQQDCIKHASDIAELMALEILNMGIDLSLAPVLDLDKGVSDVIADRAFHSQPAVVIELAKAYIAGMAKVGMAATLKHFPGHGSVVLDSHHHLPVDDRSLKELAVDMEPFSALIKEDNAKAIMTAHIIYSQCDSLPASFSKYWIQDVLRHQMGFDGVVMSDDVSMKAAHTIGTYAQRVQLALDAGSDIVLACNDRAGVLDTLDQVNYQASDASLTRIQSLRAQRVCHQPLHDEHQWERAKEALSKFMGLCTTLNPSLA